MARSTLRPMRPKPEMAILTAMEVLPIARRLGARLSLAALSCRGLARLYCGALIAVSRRHVESSEQRRELRTGCITRALVDAMRTGAYRSRQERVASQAAALDNSGFTAMAPRRAAKARSKS